MTDDERRAFVERFWATLADRDWDGLAAFFDDTSEYWDVPDRTRERGDGSGEHRHPAAAGPRTAGGVRQRA